MNDLNRMKVFYKNKDKNYWSLFNCYPFFLDCKQTYLLTKILKNINIEQSRVLDIGAGEGNFILKLLMLGFKKENITAVEYLEERYKVLIDKIPNITSINDDFLDVKLEKKHDIITLMAVLTSIVDNNIRYAIFEKALASMSSQSFLILYDYFDDKETFLSNDYGALSLNKIKQMSKNYKVHIYRNVYLKGMYAKGLCKFGLQPLIPVIEFLKIFNDNYHFVVIKNEK